MSHRCDNTVYGVYGMLKLKGYKELLAQAMSTEEPIGVQLENPKGISLNDIKDFCNDVREQTGKPVHVTFFTCDRCENLHALVVIGDDGYIGIDHPD